jgi:uncharacterized protein involved in outer membrane biogenesis
MRAFLKVIGGAFIILVAICIAVPFFFNPNDYKSDIVTQAQKFLGREVKIDGDIKVRLLPRPKLKVKDVKIASIPGARKPYLAHIGVLEVNIELLPLLKGRVVIEKVRLENARIVLEQLQNMQANWDFPSLKKMSTEKPTDALSDTSAKVKFDLHAVALNNSSILYLTPQSQQEADQINLQIKLGSLKGPYDFDGRLRIAQKDVSLQGTVHKIDDLVPATFSIETFAQKITLSGQLNLPDKAFKGELKIKGHLNDLQKLFPGCGIPEKYLTSYKMKSSLFASAQKIKAQNFECSLGNVNVFGNGEYDINTAHTKVTLKANPGNISFTLNSQPDPKFLFNGFVKMTVQDLSILLRALKIENNTLPEGLKKDLTLSAMIASYKSGALTLNNFSFSHGKANLEGTFSLTPTDQGASYSYTFKTQDFMPLARILFPSYKYDLGALAIKGESKGSLAAMSTDTHILSSVAQLDLKGTIRSKDNGASKNYGYNLFISLSGTNLKTMLKRFDIDVGQKKLGQFSIASEMKGDMNHLLLSHLKGDIKVGAGSLNWNGSAEAVRSPLRPKFSADFNFGKLDLDALLDNTPNTHHTSIDRAGNRTVGLSSQQQSLPKDAAPWSHEKIDLSFLKMLDGDLKFSSPLLHLSSFSLQNMQGTAKIVNGVLEFPNITASSFGGSASLKGRISSQQGQPVNLKMSLSKANLKELSPSQGKIKVTQGVVTLNADLYTSGNSAFEYVKSLSGTTTLSVKDGVIRGFDLQKVSTQLGKMRNLATALKLLNTSFEGGQTSFKSLDGTITIKEGIARITQMDLLAQGAHGTATGKINLPAYTLNIDAMVKLTDLPKFPPFSVRFYGPLDEPQHALDTKFLQKYLIDNVMNTLTESFKEGKKPKHILKDILGLETKKVPDTAQPTPKEQSPQKEPAPITKPEKAIKSLLKELF